MFRSLPRVPGSVDASPGYFRLNLTNKVQAEMTATEHAALYRFTFPGQDMIQIPKDRLSDSESTITVPYSPLILVDLIDLANSRSVGGIQVYEEQLRIIGEGRYGPSFGIGVTALSFAPILKAQSHVPRGYLQLTRPWKSPST